MSWRTCVIVKQIQSNQLRCDDRAMIIGSATSKTEVKHTQLHYYRHLTSRTLHCSFAVGDSDGMAIYSGPRPVSKLSQTFRFPALERKEGPGRYVLNV